MRPSFEQTIGWCFLIAMALVAGCAAELDQGDPGGGRSDDLGFFPEIEIRPGVETRVCDPGVAEGCAYETEDEDFRFWAHSEVTDASKTVGKIVIDADDVRMLRDPQVHLTATVEMEAGDGYEADGSFGMEIHFRIGTGMWNQLLVADQKFWNHIELQPEIGAVAGHGLTCDGGNTCEWVVASYHDAALEEAAGGGSGPIEYRILSVPVADTGNFDLGEYATVLRIGKTH
jgi:hypothetical protein